jgi:hypothetical protein
VPHVAQLQQSKEHTCQCILVHIVPGRHTGNHSAVLYEVQSEIEPKDHHISDTYGDDAQEGAGPKAFGANSTQLSAELMEQSLNQ